MKKKKKRLIWTAQLSSLIKRTPYFEVFFLLFWFTL